MNKTDNYDFIKPDRNDFYDIEHFNTNMDSIDTILKTMESSLRIYRPAEMEDYNDFKVNYIADLTHVGMPNAPDDINRFGVITFGMEYYRVQIAFNIYVPTKFYVRSRNYKKWTPWTCFEGDKIQIS